MEALWAPWRMELIGGEKPKGCIFCLFPAEGDGGGEAAERADAKHLIVARTARSFVILNRYPYNNGHVMVIPRAHAAELTALPEEDFADLHALLRRTIEVVKAAYRPEGFNVGMNLGACAGAGIAAHLHYHVVPRWSGDTNFMPVLGDTRVMIEHLSSTREKLKAGFDAR